MKAKFEDVKITISDNKLPDGTPIINVKLTNDACKISHALVKQIPNSDWNQVVTTLMISNIPMAKSMLTKNSQFFAMTSKERKEFVIGWSLTMALNSSWSGYNALDDL